MARNGSAIPRYKATMAPALLQQGFRPFFLGAGLWAAAAMVLWIWHLSGTPVLPSGLSPFAWHANALVFGYGSAALAGFLLTAIPNWTGRMPLQGAPLGALAALWLAGRVGVLAFDGLGLALAAALDLAFLLALLGVVAREVAAGRNWRNLPVLLAVGVFALAQVLHWLGAAGQVPPGLGARLGIAVLVLLIGLVGGRIVPSFTRNWLKKHGATAFPAPAGRADKAVLLLGVPALAAWVAAPASGAAAALCALAALAHLWRLSRWRGLATWREPLLLVLHLGYLWLPLGLALVALTPLVPAITESTALHAFTAGAIATMTLAVMTRATRGHTGRPLTADRGTVLVFVAVTLAALARLAAPLWPALYLPLLQVSGGLWIAAFGLFLVVYAPLLLRPRAG